MCTGKIIKELQTEMTELRRIRQHDRETIHNYKRKYRYVEDSSTDTLSADSGKENIHRERILKQYGGQRHDSTRLEKRISIE
ncbi:hypothetical protein CEXT_55451 [Caerostris extrusa]|uniref:Uncharacterized protein n=1 Tax=Caerostris extrusa TaxID=172846 RepID=A0AAV4T737_CAEEX|nr:hypothetical protein CEXT_55451 [Caerostris extrusa]